MRSGELEIEIRFQFGVYFGSPFEIIGFDITEG
jgi:hypothetical protein